jgi:hypothetical protein
VLVLVPVLAPPLVVVRERVLVLVLVLVLICRRQKTTG